MLNGNEILFEKNRLLNVKDLLFVSSTNCENIEIVVLVIRNGDIILYGLPFNQHHPVVRWLPWFDDIKKKICTLTLEPNNAEWALVVCADKSLYLIPVLSLLGFKDNDLSSCDSWFKHDITKLQSPFPSECEFIPCAVAWFVKPEHDSTDRHIAVIGSTTGQIIVFTLISANVLFTTKVEGRTSSIEVCNRIQNIYIIVSNDIGFQWRINLSKVENETKDDTASDTSDELKANSIELKSVKTENDIKQWTMKFRQRNKKPVVPLAVECGKEETINCGPQWQLIVKLQTVIESTLNVHTSCVTAKYPSKILTIEDYSSQVTSVHKLPVESGLITITKSLIIFTNVLLNHIQIVSRHLSSCKDEVTTNAVNMEFIKESLLQEYIFEENEKALKIFCTDYLRDRCILVTNQAFYSLKLKTDPHKLVLKYILERDNLQLAEKISLVFNLDLQKLICEAGDSQLSKGLVKEAVQLYNLTRCGGAHLILMLAVLGHMPELLDALRTCHYSPNYKLHFMNLKLLVFLHQFMTSYSTELHEEFRDLLLQSGYDEALAVSVLAQAGLCGELLFLTRMKGLQPITMNVVISIVQHYHLVNIAHCKGFWNLICDLSFCDTLLMKPQFFQFHQKLVQKNLPNLSEEIIYKLEALYNPFTVPLRSWTTCLLKGDVPIQTWIQTYLLICTHLSANEKKFNIDTIGRIAIGQDWNYINTKIGIYENRISAGFSHAAVLVDGNCYAWGTTAFSCLGTGPTTRLVSVPLFIDKFYSIGTKVLSVSCGRNHTIAITDNGVYSWGNNKYGQLGNGNIIQSSYPTLIDALVDYNIIQVIAGQYHSIALDEKQRVFTWGWGVHGQLGHGDTENCCYPKIISSLSQEKIKWCDGGQAHSVFLSESGRVWACGSNAFGQLGTGKNKKSSIPILIASLTDKIESISVGYFHNFAVTLDGRMYTWGCSPNLLRTAAKRKMRISAEEKREITSLEETFEYLIPKQLDISYIRGKIIKVVAGSEHSALLTANGNVYTWGRNMDGQLGIKTSSTTERRSQNILVPTPISLGTPAVDITCGYDFTLAMDSAGNVWTWGANHYSVGTRNALASLEGEIVLVNNKNRVIKLPHHASNVQPLPTLLNLPLEQPLLRQDRKPLLPPILKSNNWRYRMHYVIETCESIYSSPEFFGRCILVGESDASAKLLQVAGDVSSALRVTLKAAMEQQDSTTFIKSIISYYFSTSFVPADKFNEVLVVIITFWIEHRLPIPNLEDIFYSFWKVIAIPLGDIFFRIDSKHSNLCSNFSTKFKLKLVEYMISHKRNNVDCIFEGCNSVNDVLSALNKANDFVDIVLDSSSSSRKKITFKESSSRKADLKPDS